VFDRTMADWSPRQRTQFAPLLSRFVADLKRSPEDR
jgi:hypothetical protein